MTTWATVAALWHFGSTKVIDGTWAAAALLLVGVPAAVGVASELLRRR